MANFGWKYGIETVIGIVQNKSWKLEIHFYEKPGLLLEVCSPSFKQKFLNLMLNSLRIWPAMCEMFNKNQWLLAIYNYNMLIAVLAILWLRNNVYPVVFPTSQNIYFLPCQFFFFLIIICSGCIVIKEWLFTK